jgi:hypothetical protein
VSKFNAKFFNLLKENVEKQYEITATVKPWGTVRNEYIKGTQTGKSSDEALTKLVYHWKTVKRYTAPLGVLIAQAKETAKIKELPPSPEQTYWWNDK